MTTDVSAPLETEVERLQARIRRLAEEKSYLQLVIRLIEQLNPLPGIDNMVRAMLYNIVETIGGTNIKLYYWVEGELHYADFFGTSNTIAAIDDPLVAQVAATSEFVEESADAASAMLRDGVIAGAWTWGFPLLVGKDLIGIIKLENLHISGSSLRNYLPIFFSHAALILSNEIRNHIARRDQEALRASERKLAEILDNVSAFIYLKDLKGCYLYANRPVRDLFRCSLAEIIGRSDAEFFDGATAENLKHNDERVLKAGETIRQEETNVDRHTGRMATYWSVKLPLRREDGTIYALCGISTDITERKNIEATLQQYNERLENEVRQRTTELVQARDDAESANRMKSVFLANMSHELRTPLNAILGFAQLMERDSRIPEDTRHNLDTINRSGQHLLSLINDVLEISRIEAGRLTLNVHAVDLHDLLGSITEVMALRASNKGLALRLELSPNLPRHVSADLGKLRQIVLNLLSNAVKYTEHGEVVLRGSAVVTGNKATVRLEVNDTGVGIPHDDLERIFQPFVQTEYGMRLGEGTGLGLTICREYARLLGGEISADSTVGQGSIFCFSFPAELAERAESATGHDGRQLSLAPGQPVRRILVAEDSPDSLRLALDLLRDAGFEVEAAVDGRQAVEMFRSWQPHLILMDMRMPVMDGYEAVRAIRKLPAGSNVPIIALTASAFEEDRPKILAAGCTDVARKPIEADQLIDTIATHLHASLTSAKTDEVVIKSADINLSALPLPLRQRLHAAAVALDSDIVRSIVAEFADTHPAASRHILNLAANYHFDTLADELESIEQGR